MITTVSKETCIGCALCPTLSPDLYTMDDDGKAIPIKTGVLSTQEEIDAEEAADSCPVDAIEVK